MEAESEVNVKKSYFTQKDGYTSSWGNVLEFLYFCLFGLSIYSAYVIYNEYVMVKLKVDTDIPVIAPNGVDISLKYMQHAPVRNFALMTTIIVNSLICFYLFYSNNANDYKILLFNCILGFACLVAIPEYILSVVHDGHEEIFSALFAASLGLILSATIVVKMLMRSY